MMVSPGWTMSVSFTFSSFLIAIDDPDDLRPVHGAVRSDPAGQRKRLQHGRVGLDGIRRGILDLAEHVHEFRAGDVDRVAVTQIDVPHGSSATLQILQVEPEDFLGAGRIEYRWARLPLWLLARRPPLHSHSVSSIRPWRALR